MVYLALCAVGECTVEGHEWKREEQLGGCWNRTVESLGDLELQQYSKQRETDRFRIYFVERIITTC